MCPKIFQQSYSLHAVIDGKCIPLVFALLSDKTEKTYVFLLNLLKSALGDISDGIIMVDFEKAMMNAISCVFDQFSLMNCFFHLCQSVQKRINKNFKVRYRKDKAFARASRLVAFLAFVPLNCIEDAFEALSVHIAGTYPELLAVVNYFENNYLGQATPEGPRTSPKFPLEFWNHHSTIMVDPDYPRTSNMVEGFHRGFKTRVNRARPTVQEYFRAIREQQVTTDFHLDRLRVGLTPSKKRRTNNDSLHRICSSYGDFSSTLEYLFAIAEFFGHTVTA